jgi:hypothetical protein
MIILKSLLWEYYLFRRDSVVKNVVCDISGLQKVKSKSLVSCSQHSLDWHIEKYDLLVDWQLTMRKFFEN